MRRSILPVIYKFVASIYFIEVLFLLLLVIRPVAVEASSNKQSNQNNWFISGNTGIAIRSLEISKGFHFTADGFRHHPGFAFDLSFGKTIANRWEPAVRLGAYTLFGKSDLPHYSSVGYYAAYPDLLKQEPLEYVTQSNSISLILRFIFFKDALSRNNALKIRPFIEAGLGVNNFTTELRYSKIPAGEHSSLIYSDRNGENVNGGSQIVSGLGLKIGEQGEWNAVILINAERVNFSRLNAIHHITNIEKSNSRAIVSRITAGITIPIRRTVKTDDYLPFRW